MMFSGCKNGQMKGRSNMKRNIFIMIGFVLVLLLSACGTAPAADSSTENGSTSEEITTAERGEADENALAESTELIMGTILLQNSEQAVNAAQAGTLLTLWKAYRSLVNSETSAEEEVSALLEQIKGEMTPGQLAAIEALGLTNGSIQDKMQELGVEMGKGMGFDFDPDMSQEEMQATREAMRESGQGPGGDLPPGTGPGGNRPGGEGIPLGEDMDPEQLATLQAQRGAMGGRGGIDRFMITALINYLEGLVE
jgi:hypothetical protein